MHHEIVCMFEVFALQAEIFFPSRERIGTSNPGVAAVIYNHNTERQP